MTTEVQQIVKQWLEKLTNSNQSNEIDSRRMQGLLHKCGFPEAVVVCGIVYLEGKGTIDCPPMSIHQIAQEILKRQS